MNSGDTAWVLVCCSLVLLMTPALALFYGGMVRKKNLLSTLTLSFIFMALISVQWVLYGYSLSFGADIKGLIGGLNYLGFIGVDALPNGAYSQTIPHALFAAFQMMFAVITPALITGAFVERIKFKAFLLFGLLWATLIYDPLCHWVWGQGGWLKETGGSRLCRWYCGSYCRRIFRFGFCNGYRTAKRIRQISHGAEQYPSDGVGSRTTVGRLVRL